jgi:hypothetical protein
LEDARSAFRYALDFHSRRLAIVCSIDNQRCIDSVTVSLDVPSFVRGRDHLPPYGVSVSESLHREVPATSKAAVIVITRAFV